MTPSPGAPAGAPKKKLSGCFIALLVVGGLIGLSCLITGAMVYRASQSPEGKKVFAAMGKGIELAAKGVNAPGAEELRQAGCPQALVMNMGEMIGEFAELFDAGTEVKTRGQGKLGGTMVLCQGNVFADLPDCDTLAGVYVSAAHPADGFTVMVKSQGKQQAKCQRHYEADGSFVEELK